MSIRSRLRWDPLLCVDVLLLCLRAYLGGIAPQHYSRRGWDSEWQDGRAVITIVGENSPATGVVREAT